MYLSPGWQAENCISTTEGFTSFNQIGGPAAIGNTRYGWWTASHIHHSHLLEELSNGNNNHIGPLIEIAKGLCDNEYTMQSVIVNLSLMGSPSMPIWSSTPTEFSSMSHPLSIPESGEDNFIISTGIEGALVCVYQENEGFYAFGLTDQQGQIAFDVDLNSTDKLWITASAINVLPYQYWMIPGVPGPPQSVSIQSAGAPDNHPLISWNANPEPDIAGYDIYRNLIYDPQNQSGYLKQNSSLVTNTSWTDQSFSMSHQGDTRADYYVIAVDNDEYKSEPSKEVSTIGFSIDSDESSTLFAPISEGIFARPNPFNAETAIDFLLLSDQHVTLRVYNMQGRLVRELFDGNVVANRLNHCVFNTDNLSSGIYLCRLSSEQLNETKKLIVIK
ncbi:T9SS type A sorting domain-containing protein [bacterium]|nr:T9SS type A sorting domain-containing protein [bacterium]